MLLREGPDSSWAFSKMKAHEIAYAYLSDLPLMIKGGFSQDSWQRGGSLAAIQCGIPSKFSSFNPQGLFLCEAMAFVFCSDGVVM